MNFYYEPNRFKRTGFERSRKGSGLRWRSDMHVGVGLKEWVPTREIRLWVKKIMLPASACRLGTEKVVK